MVVVSLIRRLLLLLLYCERVILIELFRTGRERRWIVFARPYVGTGELTFQLQMDVERTKANSLFVVIKEIVDGMQN